MILRVVIRRDFLSLSSIPGHGCRVETLWCGHKVVMKKSAPSAERRRCKECEALLAAE